VETVTLRPERTTLAVVLVLLLGSLPLGLSSWWLTPVLLVPVAALTYVLRAHVTASPEGLEICNGLGVRRVAWADVAGFQVPKHGPVLLLRHGGRPLRLTAADRRHLPQLLAASPREEEPS
jgi:hypothetical protein